MSNKKSTGKFDKNGQEIFEGNILFGKTIDGDYASFKVQWSEYRGKFIGDNTGEIYDISEDIFGQYELVRDENKSID